MPRNSLKKTLANISETQSLDQLDIFKDQSKWKSLEKDDLHLLADLFIKKGSSEIKKEPRQAEESFEIALKLTSFDPYVSIKISDLWAKSSKWDEAVEEVKRTLERYPKHEEAWTQLATLYLQKGRFSRDDEFLDKSREVFEYLMELKATLPPFAYHLWGQTYLLSGRFSEEPCDFTMALEKFKEAEKQGFADHHLFSDHSMALFELSNLLGRIDLLYESVSFLLKAVEINPLFHEGWVHIGLTYKTLYEAGEGEDFYDKAEVAFVSAARLNSHSKPLWLTWGQLLLKEGKTKRNNEILHLAVQKFERADSLFPNDRDIQCFLADTLMVLGLIEERYELLKEARDKIEGCLQDRPEDSAVLFLYGTCIVHMGKYFHDENLIRQSFEKYEKAIALNPNDPHIWQSLGMAHYTLGEMTLEANEIEKAVQLFETAFSYDEASSPDILNNWGVALMKLAEVTDDLHHVQIAADKFEQAIATHSQTNKDANPDPEWYYNYGCALDYLGDYYQDPGFYEKSIQILSHVLTEFPTYTQARYNLALSLTHLGDATRDIECLEMALSHFEWLLHEDPEDEIILTDTGLAHLTLAEIYQGSQSLTSTKQHFEEAEIKLLQAQSAGSKAALYWLGCLYSLLGNYPESMFFLQKAHESDHLPNPEDMQNETWLDGVRSTTSFKKFISTLY